MTSTVPVLLTVWTAVASGQVNVEPLASYTNKPGWGLDVRGRFGLATGNVEFLDLSGDAALHWSRPFPAARRPNDHGAWQRDRFVVFGSYGLRLQGVGEGAQRMVDTKFVHVRYTHMAVPWLGLDSFAQLGDDAVLLLASRALVGGGLRLVPVDARRISVAAGTGYMVEREERPADAGGATFVNHRSTSYLTLELALVPDALSVLSTTYVQPRLDDVADVQVLEEATLRVAVTDRLTIGIELQLRHDSRPPADLRPTDLRLTNTLQLRLAPRERSVDEPADADAGG